MLFAIEQPYAARDADPIWLTPSRWPFTFIYSARAVPIATAARARDGGQSHTPEWEGVNFIDFCPAAKSGDLRCLFHPARTAKPAIKCWPSFDPRGVA